MKRTAFTALSAFALIAGGALIATQALAHGPAHMFEKFDANKDGKVTRAEAHKKVLEHFSEVDANADKLITPDEAKKFHEQKRKEHGTPEQRIEARFKAHDKNQDGKIERSESNLPDKVFARFDKNGDGAITKAEALEAHNRRHEKRGKDHPGKGSQAGKAHDKKHGPRGGSPFARVDTSGDGKISQAEAKGAADRVFSRLDKNNDNVVTRAEVTAPRKDRQPEKSGKERAKKSK